VTPFGVGAGESWGVELADERERAEEGLGETHTFFFGETDDLDREWHSLPCCGELFDQRDAKHDAEDTIEGTCVSDGCQDASR